MKSYSAFVEDICKGQPKLEATIMAGYKVVTESDDEDSGDRDPIFEEGEDDASDEDNKTITMNLDSIADNADKIQGVLQQKKQATDTSKKADEELRALGNDTDEA